MSMPTNTAKDILKRHWDGALPVDPKEIAVSMGVAVESFGVGFDECNEDLSISGEFRNENGAPLIRYNGIEAPVRQRFTIAHELGHYSLNHGSAMRDTSNAFSLNNYDNKEVEANQFAAELLMPQSAIKEQVMQKGNKTLNGLARIFEVSQVAMRYRLKNLGWISK